MTRLLKYTNCGACSCYLITTNPKTMRVIADDHNERECMWWKNEEAKWIEVD